MAWNQLAEQRVQLCTTTLVLAELGDGFATQAQPAFAADRLASILGSPSITVIQPTPDDLYLALEWMKKFSDQGVGLTDAVSFELMRRHEVRRAFCFDRHFQIAGFERWPD